MFVGIPKGLRDILPQEAKERRDIEAKLRELFRSWGYGEVITPTFEYFDVLSSETGELIEREMIKFFDIDGRALALRPELTTPIARLVAQRLGEELAPYRLFYVAEVFREEAPQRGQQREFSQVGVELIGDSSPCADAEVLELMVASLLEIGLEHFEIGLGQIEFVKGLLEDSSVPMELRPSLRDAVSSKNLVALERLADELPRPVGEALTRIPLLRGEGALEEAGNLVTSDRSERALENLTAITGILKEAGLDRFVSVDLGIVRNFDYYTGAIYEGYAASLGFPISGGGRYDNLLGEFGRALPATGFQHGLERLHIALAEEGAALNGDANRRCLVGYADSCYEVYDVSQRLRLAGLDAVQWLTAVTDQEGVEAARRRGFRWFVRADAEAEVCRVHDLATGEERVVPLADLEVGLS